MRRLLTFISILLCHSFFHAQIQLPSVWSSDMVLQQNSRIKLWGNSLPNKEITVTVSWSNTKFSSWTSNSGNFEVELFTPSGSFTAQQIKIRVGSETKELKNILIGEVWLCSGQSNMAMTFRGYKNQPVADAQETISDTTNRTSIRTFNANKEASYEYKSETKGEWIAFEGKSKINFSAVGYFFAQQLQDKLNVPIGIINSSFGGTYIEGWLNEETLKKYPEVSLKKDVADSVAYMRHAVFYYNMIRPLRNFKIKGVLWYQGESNTGAPKGYHQKLQDLIFLLRYSFSDLTLPFIVVEIAPYLYSNPTDAAKLREQQSQVALGVPNCGIISTSDLVPLQEANNIHPPLKKPIGERLAQLALNLSYPHLPKTPQSPRFNRYELEGSSCMLYFDFAEKGFSLVDSSQNGKSGFEVADSTKQFQAVSIMQGPVPNSLKLLLPERNFGMLQSIRYCFKNFEEGTVFNREGLPLFPFRTDNWE